MRRGKIGGGREVVESDSGSDGPWYVGMETGDAWVVKLSYLEIQRSEREGGKGHECVDPPGGHRVAGGKGKKRNNKNSYVAIRGGG